MLRVDLHLHSRHSDRPNEWILRRMGVPQSYSSPEELYRKLHTRGMNLKTITDHDSIEGVLAIAHYPDVFLSEEVTTYFPDGCPVHLLVWDITEEDHREIQKVRANIYELAAFLTAKGIAHAVTHPLVPLSDNWTVDHFERLLLLFKIFEVRNGNRERLSQLLCQYILEALTPEKIEELANRHNLLPTHPEPHRKWTTGGSDDHGGLFVACAWTEWEGNGGPKEFFAGLWRGEAQAMGEAGDPFKFSSSLYNTLFGFLRDRLQSRAPLAASLLSKVAERFVAGRNPAAFSFGERIGHVAEVIRSGQVFELVRPGEGGLAREFAKFFTDPRLREALDERIEAETLPQRRSFRVASYLVDELGYRLFVEFVRRWEHQNYLEALETAAGFVAVAGAVVPYLVGFARHAVPREILGELARRFPVGDGLFKGDEGRAWFTDTLEDVNGVARTIVAVARAAMALGRKLTVVTSRCELRSWDIPVKNFPPVGQFEIPEYELQKLSFPPVLDVLEWVYTQGYGELIVSTPGPVGLVAVMAGKLLRLPLIGIYHTDFPQYARFLSDDAFIESLTWKYMQWFYGQMDLVYVNSSFYRQKWIERGLAEEKLRIFWRGLDSNEFHPGFRDERFWIRRGARGPVLVYVGRISKEKGLAFLVEVLRELERRGRTFTMAFVGDGPYRKELGELWPKGIFTGFLSGPELSQAYASAELFLFPSTTDTFGNAVLEAMGCGLFAVVTDVGGPCELVRSLEGGYVVSARDLLGWVETIERLLEFPPSWEARKALAERVRMTRSWESSVERLWAHR
ncbi:Histidinol-phosphatase [Candidatus Methylacidithermus pantelleriae]|uniref:Histidinol-phosphatase n=2 Tax=Candidatus Methylacidithermus pantelleriae TaxID=2744239 RepID=A0A8J2BSR1_9BACT|nr:Histidinol-phosphatase [Candidatus Methylacidithermus pantelleriae]